MEIGDAVEEGQGDAEVAKNMSELFLRRFPQNKKVLQNHRKPNLDALEQNKPCSTWKPSLDKYMLKTDKTEVLFTASWSLICFSLVHHCLQVKVILVV